MANITACAVLSDAQTAEIRALEAVVLTHDHTHSTVFLTGELNFDPTAPCFFLLHEEDGTLAAFLTLFFPTHEEGEVAAFTHPQFRRKGYFTALLARAKETLRALALPIVLYSLERGCTDGHAALARMPDAAFSHAEHRMRIAQMPASAPVGVAQNIRFCPVTEENWADYRAVKCAVTPELMGNETFLRAVITEEKRAGILGYNQQGTAVCACGLNTENGGVFLYSVAVLASERGQGIGKALMLHALQQIFAQGHYALLDVDEANTPAVRLYESCGFTYEHCTEYYTQPLQPLL